MRELTPQEAAQVASDSEGMELLNIRSYRDFDTKLL